MNQGNLTLLGKSFDTYIDVPNVLVWNEFLKLEAGVSDDVIVNIDGDVKADINYDINFDEINFDEVELNSPQKIAENSDQKLIKKPLPRTIRILGGAIDCIEVVYDDPENGFAIADDL